MLPIKGKLDRKRISQETQKVERGGEVGSHIDSESDSDCG